MRPITGNAIEIEREVRRMLCEHRAADAGQINFGALVSDELGDEVTFGEAIDFLVANSAVWREAFNRR